LIITVERGLPINLSEHLFLKGIGMNKKYTVRLTADERKGLEDLLKKGKTQAYRIKHANILLAIDADGPNWPDHQAAKAYKCHENTVRNVRQRFVEQGLEAALERKIQQEPSRKRIIDGEKEARLISIACSTPPEGRAKWTVQMLADELVILKVVDSVSGQTVWRTLKKTNLNLT
jgi:transposase